MNVLDFSNVYPSLMNLIVVGMMAVIFISVSKFLLARWPVPGLTDLIGSI